MAGAYTLKTYGNSELPAGTSDRPLVTFALFAYNQKEYIRDAVGGALSQTYCPLEIILSDDCSSDSTFEIMIEMAEKYRGPHQVHVRQNHSNRGLGRHFHDLAMAAKGKYVVVAAGDDVSLPHRTECIINFLETESASHCESMHNIISEDGATISCNVISDHSQHYLWTIIDAEPRHYASGATAAYRTDFMREAVLSAAGTIRTGKLFHEDSLMAAFAVARNSPPVNYTEAPVVDYRLNPSSLSNFRASRADLRGEIETIKKEIFRSSTRLALLSAIEEMAGRYPELAVRVNFERLNAQKRLSEVELAASQPLLAMRVRSLVAARTSREFQITAARLFGPRPLAVLRLLARLVRGT